MLIVLLWLRLNHAILNRGDVAGAISVLHDVALADQGREYVRSCAIVFDTLGQLITLRLDRIELCKFLLNVQLLLLGNQPLSIDFLLGAASLSADLEHVGSVAANDYHERVRDNRFNLRLTDVELRKA